MTLRNPVIGVVLVWAGNKARLPDSTARVCVGLSMELGGPFLSPEEVQEVLRHSTATNKGGFILNGQATWSLVPGGLVVTSVPSGELYMNSQLLFLFYTYVRYVGYMYNLPI